MKAEFGAVKTEIGDVKNEIKASEQNIIDEIRRSQSSDNAKPTYVPEPEPVKDGP